MSYDPREYVDAAQASRILGLTPGRFRALVERRHAPAPVGRHLGRPTWLRSDIEEWAQRNATDGRRTPRR